MGLQSANNDILKMLGRIHTYEEFENGYNLARKVGFDNINVDLMIGLPKQKLDDVTESLDKVIKLNPEHISVYSLIVEEETKLSKMLDAGELLLPDEDLERKMYWTVKDTLEKNGYCHYEISNFSIPAHESKHNMNCWNQHEYLGFGLAAHSYFKSVRYSNIENLEEYIENIETGNVEKNKNIHELQTIEDCKKEYMLLGLRKIEGVNITEFKNKFVDNPLYLFRKELSKLVQEELIEIENNNIKLTNRGIDLANIVWEEFV